MILILDLLGQYNPTWCLDLATHVLNQIQSYLQAVDVVFSTTEVI